MNQFLRAVLVLLFLFCFASHGFALQAKKVDPEGKILLDDGKTFQLAGLTLAEGAQTALSVILAGKELDIDQEPALTGPAGISLVYVRVKTTEMDFPFTGTANTREQKVLVNDLLIQFGLAKADRTRDYKLRAQFEASEDAAKLSGKGIWSYEDPRPKPVESPSAAPSSEVPKAPASEVIAASPSPTPS